MKLEINKAQLAIIFEALAQSDTMRLLRSMAEGYTTEMGTPITAGELGVHHDILLEVLSEHVEVEEGEWTWVNDDRTIDCYHDEEGEEF